ncbi:carbamoyltransferase N-terminal domain-containing protein [Nonomuraea sp. WAC 01424]|uniref:carbamoyltransferase N-terminal domain-containing protein n=1 Tax=Nonomuraea sp. WAC 01424 TaxID=2203200 RepID=UPI001C8CE361|nr:carbamoyltransferase N-terminal domain-containing protein [Nonomuraea sp. WAC 01424]
MRARCEPGASPPSRTGYFGVGEGSASDEEGRLFGRKVRYFSSTHERSHIYSSLGMASPIPGQEYYALVWEGHIGSFYRVNAKGEATHLEQVMSDPGSKYAYLFALADPTHPGGAVFRFNDAGKQMALTGFADDAPITRQERKTIEHILKQERVFSSLSKADMSSSHVYNKGVESQEYKKTAKRLSDAIFQAFHDYAEKNLTEGLPLLISGGCGLNCDWNRMWRESGLFESVFVPPCPNDSVPRSARQSTPSGTTPARPASNGRCTRVRNSRKTSNQTRPPTSCAR